MNTTATTTYTLTYRHTDDMGTTTIEVDDLAWALKEIKGMAKNGLTFVRLEVAGGDAGAEDPR